MTEKCQRLPLPCKGPARFAASLVFDRLRVRGAALTLVVAFFLISALAARASGASHTLSEHVEAALTHPKLEKATVGVCVVAAGSGRLLYHRNAMESLIPASNQKLLTAATALAELGPDYRFRTELYVLRPRGPDADVGALYLRGGGDPTLSSPSAGYEAEAQFEEWAGLLTAEGVTRVAGDLIVDDSFFDREFVHPDWPARQLWREYCAPVGALSFHDNCVTVTVKPGARAGGPASVRIWPDVPLMEVKNLCKTSERRHLIWFDRQADSPLLRVGGHVRAGSGGYAGRASVPDPGLFAGQAFARVLQREGIELGGRVRRGVLSDSLRRAEPLAVRSTPLTDVLRVMLEESHNGYAEHVIKTVGAETEGEGSWRAGLARTESLLRSLHFKAGQFKLADGSGISRNNRVTAALICAVLLEVERSGEGELLRELMASPGEGTLARRFQEADYRDRVWAKTGYLHGVGALSGYARTRSGILVAFSVLINGFPGSNSEMKRIEDGVVRAIIDHAE